VDFIFKVKSAFTCRIKQSKSYLTLKMKAPQFFIILENHLLNLSP